MLAAPKLRTMVEVATRAGLWRPGALEASLDARIGDVRSAYLNDLHELEKVKA